MHECVYVPKEENNKTRFSSSIQKLSQFLASIVLLKSTVPRLAREPQRNLGEDIVDSVELYFDIPFPQHDELKVEQNAHPHCPSLLSP